MTEDRADFQMTETAGQKDLEVQFGKQRLEDDQAGKRGQAMVIKCQLRERMKLAMDNGLAILHVNGLC